MAPGTPFSREDIEQIEAHGLTVRQVEQQLELFREGIPPVALNRPCTVGDGILSPGDGERERYAVAYESAAAAGRIRKFTPASGAATRMFRDLLALFHLPGELTGEIMRRDANKGDKKAEFGLAFFDNITCFAFYPALKQALRVDDEEMQMLVKHGDCKPVLERLLTDKGLGYAGLPKGLIAFHRYGDTVRTAFEEQLIEAANVIRDETGKIRVHFTVPVEHRQSIREHVLRFTDTYKTKEMRFKVDYSVQKPSTDTIAVTPENEPFRSDDGRLLFRPGGHGALLENLDELEADIVLIKNIDNVVVSRYYAEVDKCWKLLAGLLVTLEGKIHEALRALESGPLNTELLQRIESLLKSELMLELPPDWPTLADDAKRKEMFEMLNRPLRVCGMVRAVGEPGGGPFWVNHPDGRVSRQVVETSQIDTTDPAQKEMLEKATHFNPVLVAASLKNHHGEPFRLQDFIDPDTAFIAEKSRDGKPLKALEHPGLWNGSMASWNTLFVEVPIVNFNPVKSVNDLLRENHQG